MKHQESPPPSLPSRIARAILGWIAQLHLPLLAFTLVVVLKQVAVIGQFGEALGLGADRLVLGSIGLALLLGQPVLRRGGRRQILWLLAFDTLLTLWALGDLLYFRAFGDLATVASLRYAWQVGDVGSSIFVLLQPRDWILLASGPAAALLGLLAPPRCFRELSLRAVATYTSIGAILVAGVFLTTPRLTRLRHRGNAFLAGELGIPGFHAWDIGSYLAQRGSRLVPDPALEEEARTHFEELSASIERGWAAEAGEPSAGLAALRGSAKGKNLLILQFEALQTFVIDMELDGQPITPYLNAFRDETLSSLDFFHQTATGRSSDAKFVVNCSLHALGSGAAVFEAVNNELYCLPTLLGEAGYTSAAMQLLRPDFWNASSIDATMGFDRSYSDRDFEHDELIGYGLSDRSFYRQLQGEARGLAQPHYIFAQNLSTHTPFHAPELPKELRLGALEGTMLGHYLQAIHYGDRAFGELIERMRADGSLEETLLVVYGDHDGVTRRLTELAEPLEIDPEDEWRWFQVEWGSPLYIRIPGALGAGEVLELGGQIDLAPTILDLLGIERRGSYLMGRSLIAAADGQRQVIVPNGTTFDGERLLVRRPDGAVRCYGEGGAIPMEACKGIDRRASHELRLSRGIIAKDLFRSLARERPELISGELP